MSDSTRKCVKCSNDGEFYSTDPKQAVYCRECFLQMVHHKFSYSLGKYHVFKEAMSEDALIVYTGDECSALLVSLICQGLSVTPAKRLRIRPRLLCIFTENDMFSIEENIRWIRESIEHYKHQGWTLYFVHIAAILISSFDIVENTLVGADEFWIDNFSSLLHSVKDTSVRRELIRLLNTILLVRIARLLNCRRVALPDNAEKLANDSFNALCFGRGSAICELTAVVDNRLNDVQFVRPFRDIYDREIHTYHRLHDSSAKFILRTRDTDSDDGARITFERRLNGDNDGIQRQNADFIYSLKNGGFPATVPTILSIASKVKSSCDEIAISNERRGSKGDTEVGENKRNDSTQKDRNERFAASKCEACFAVIVAHNTKMTSGLTSHHNDDDVSFHTEHNSPIVICEACAVIFDEIEGTTHEKLMKVIKGI